MLPAGDAISTASRPAGHDQASDMSDASIRRQQLHHQMELYEATVASSNARIAGNSGPLLVKDTDEVSLRWQSAGCGVEESEVDGDEDSALPVVAIARRSGRDHLRVTAW